MKKFFSILIQVLISLNAIVAILSVFFVLVRSIVYARDISFKFSYYLGLTLILSTIWYLTNGTRSRNDSNGG